MPENRFSGRRSNIALLKDVLTLQPTVLSHQLRRQHQRPGGNPGLGARLSQDDYDVNTLALASGYMDDFAVDDATVVSKHYKVNSLLTGPYYSFALGRVTLKLRGLIGISAATLPTLRVSLEDQSTFTQGKATATRFTYQFGAGLRNRL